MVVVRVNNSSDLALVR